MCVCLSVCEGTDLKSHIIWYGVCIRIYTLMDMAISTLWPCWQLLHCVHLLGVCSGPCMVALWSLLLLAQRCLHTNLVLGPFHVVVILLTWVGLSFYATMALLMWAPLFWCCPCLCLTAGRDHHPSTCPREGDGEGHPKLHRYQGQPGFQRGRCSAFAAHSWRCQCCHWQWQWGPGQWGGRPEQWGGRRRKSWKEERLWHRSKRRRQGSERRWQPVCHWGQ